MLNNSKPRSNAELQQPIVMNMEKAITSITRSPLSKNSDLYGIGGRDIMKIIKLTLDDSKEKFKIVHNLKTAKCSPNMGTTDLQWNLDHGIFLHYT